MMTDTNPSRPLPPYIPAKRSSRVWLYVLGLLVLAVAGACYYVVTVFLPGQTQAAKPLPAVTVGPSDPLLPRLVSLNTRLDSVDKTLAELLANQRLLQSDMTLVKGKLDRPAPVAAATPPVVRTYRAPRAPKPVAQLTPPVDATQLLSVDTWDNKPSIVLRGADGGVRFAQDGETTAQGRYSVARGGAQSVRVERKDGTSSVLHVAGER